MIVTDKDIALLCRRIKELESVSRELSEAMERLVNISKQFDWKTHCWMNEKGLAETFEEYRKLAEKARETI
jgi:hypothetical protein